MSAPLEPFAGPPVRASLAAAPLPRRVREPLEELLALVSDVVAGRLGAAVDELEHLLLRRADQASSPSERARYMDNLRAVQYHRERLAPHFSKALEAALAQLRAPATPSRPSAVRPMSELRLLEDDEATAEALLDRIMTRCEARAGLPLHLLGQRFGVLAAQPAFDAKSLPVGPYRLGAMIGRACEELGIDMEARLELIQLFDRVVLDDFERFVEAMNAALARRGVLPSLTYVPVRAQPRAQGGGPTLVPLEAAAAPMATGWGEMAGSFDSVQQMLERRRGLLGRLRAGLAPSASHQAPLATAEVLALLRPLQTQPASDVSQVRSALRQAAPGRELLPEDADIFELLGLYLTHLRRDMRPDGAGMQLLERLQVALLRVALQDHRFFEYPNHPARQLLASVADAGARWLADDDLDPQLQATLQRAVDTIATGYDADLRVFESANQAVQEQQQAAVRKSEVAERRQVEAARGKERLAASRQRATEVIERATAGRELPRLTCVLLTQAWTDVLTLTLLRHDLESDEWQRQLATTREIVDALAGGPAAADLERRICDALTTVGYHPDEAATLARWLSGGDEVDDESAASRTELAMRLRARTRLGEQSVGEAPVSLPLTSGERTQLDALRAIPAGRWFEFRLGPEQVVRRRLAWRGPVTGMALFVNRRGQRADELPLDRLARLVATGRARAVDEETDSLAERAWAATLATLRGFEHGASPDTESA